MAKKPVESGAPETSATKKAVVRKTAAKKAAATEKAAAKSGKKNAAGSPVEAPIAKTGVNKAKAPAKTAAKSAGKTADKPAAVLAQAPVVQPKSVEETASPMTVRRESFRPRRSSEQQHERHDQNGGDVFAQPETVGGAGENPFNKRKRRRRNKKGNGGGEDRQPVQDVFVAKQFDGKKLASRAWKMFLAEVSEEGLALMDDQTAREAARRAFRCAEFFMMEEVRRKNIQKSPVQQDKPQTREDEQGAAEEFGEE